MSGFSDQLEEIKSLISSAATKANKSFAYSTLLHLKQLSSDCHDSIQMLARSLIRPTVADVRNNDEEIATQALKCLGFMIYHPSNIAEIAAEDVKFVLDSLAKLITTTKMKGRGSSPEPVPSEPPDPPPSSSFSAGFLAPGVSVVASLELVIGKPFDPSIVKHTGDSNF